MLFHPQPNDSRQVISPLPCSCHFSLLDEMVLVSTCLKSSHGKSFEKMKLQKKHILKFWLFFSFLTWQSKKEYMKVNSELNVLLIKH